MSVILSDTIYITVLNPSTESIEKILIDRYGSVIRWAIVGVEENNKLKISVSYEKGV